MAYCRMGQVEGGMIDGVSAPGLGIDLSPGWTLPSTWAEGAKSWLSPGLLASIAEAEPTPGVPSLLARPVDSGPADSSGSKSSPWLLLAGLGLVAYLAMK